jgi:hypothetical protein
MVSYLREAPMSMHSIGGEEKATKRVLCEVLETVRQRVRPVPEDKGEGIPPAAKNLDMALRELGHHTRYALSLAEEVAGAIGE